LEFIGSGYYLFGVGGAGVDIMDIVYYTGGLPEITSVQGVPVPNILLNIHRWAAGIER
jgi:hypothetical protein